MSVKGAEGVSRPDVSAPSAASGRAARQDPLVGKVIDNRYRLLSLLARGGMGKVYRAEQAQLNRPVALKLLEIGKNGDQDEEFRRRFMLEAATCARLTHPNTVRIFDYGNTWDDILYIAMEFLDGRTLHHVVKTEAPLGAERILRIARQVSGSLREAHGLGLVHRDLKPANVVLTQHGDDADFVKVLDFGLVKELRGDAELTSGDAVVGSPSYMAPEQIRAEPLDGRTDIYALGIILYACITGRTPFTGDNSVNVLLMHLNQAPPPLPPDSPALREAPSLAWLTMTCLEKDRDRRFADIDEVVRALRICERELSGERGSQPSLSHGRILGERSAPASRAIAHERPEPPPPEPSMSTFVTAITRRNGPLLAIGSLVLAGLFALVAAGVGAAWWFLREPAMAPPSSEEAPAPAPAVRLTTVPPGAIVRRDGATLGESPLDLGVPAGETWTVEVSAAGYASETRSVTATEGRVSVVLQPLPSPAPRPASAPTSRTAVAPAAPSPAPGSPSLAPAPPAAEPTPPAAQPTPPPARPRSSDLRDPWAD